MKLNTLWSRYSFVWITAFFFLFSLVGHWIFAWYAFVDEQLTHGEPIETSAYIIETARDTLENWQSEFLQLIWQVVGLAFLFYVGSSQSKEGDDRKEEKIDLILKAVSKEGEEEIKKLDKKFARS